MTMLPDYVNSKLVTWSLKLVSLASTLLRLFGTEFLALAFRLLCTVAWPFVSYYKLGQEIAHRTAAVLEFTASDSGRGATAPHVAEQAYRDAPEPVRRYLQYALPPGGPPNLKCVCLKQSGYFRFLPSAGGAATAASADGGKAWKRLRGEAYVSVSRPGLLWTATISLTPLTWVRGFAGYLRGRGSTHWRLCSLFRVHDDVVPAGRSLDSASLLRFLAEAPCYPPALLPSSYLRWEPIDQTSARAIITDAGLRTSAVFRFNALGQIVGMRTTDAPVTPEPGAAPGRGNYVCYYRNYAQLGRHELRIPTEVEAAWELGCGEYSYAQIQVDDLVCWDSMEMPHHGDY